MSADLHFGECPGCGNGIERPFWDRYCFSCQDEFREQDEERDERLREEDHYLYSVPMIGDLDKSFMSL